ncbi:MAG: M23 family metallopeptidase [Actinomycetes bacterium]
MNSVLLGLLAAAVTSTMLTSGWESHPAGLSPSLEPGVGVDTRATAPVQPLDVVRGFDAAETYAPGHRGVDLRAWPGQVVRSVLPGSVQFVGKVAGRPIVVIAHDGDVLTTYLPIRPSVRVGDVVSSADPIGRLAAAPHCSTGPCLHWGARRHFAYFDPLTLLPGRVVLLPEVP